MIAFSVILAFDSVISDHALNFYDFWSFYAFGLAGSFTGGLLMLAKTGKRRMVEDDVRKVGIRPVALVTALASTQPFFTLAFAVLLSAFRPGILKEMIDRQTAELKLAAIALIFAGAILVVAV